MSASGSAIGYSGDPSVALHECYRREASLALELIIKAIVAQRLADGSAARHVTRVRETHDLVSLWKDAKLPPLEHRLTGALIVAKHTLLWTGRYAAPKEDEQAERMAAEAEPYRPVVGTVGELKIYRQIAFGWDEFDAIYQIAQSKLAELRQEGTETERS